MSTLRMSSGIDCERPHKPWAWLHAHSWDILAMVPISANLFGPTSSKRIGNVSVNTLPSSVNSLAAQVGTCSVVFFASSSSSIAEAAAAAPVAFVFLVLFVLSFLLLITFLFLLFVIVNDDDEEEEEAEHFGVRLLLIVAEEDVLVQLVKGIVEEEKVIALFSLSLFY